MQDPDPTPHPASSLECADPLTAAQLRNLREFEQSPSANTTGISLSISLTTAMDIAYNQLELTLQQATAYRSSTDLNPDMLQLHITSIVEDMDLLSTFTPDNDEDRTKIVQILCNARHTKRMLQGEMIQLNAEIQKISKVAPPPSVESETSSAKARAAGLKLTPLNLPTFDGTPTQFPVYRDFFEENIIRNADLTDTGKWLRLKESLKGDAAELISELPQSERSLKVAWKLLTTVYGGNDRPIAENYNKIQALPAATMVTQSLRIVHSKLEGLLMSLEDLGHDVDSNQFLRFTYMTKFPADILYSIQKEEEAPLSELRLLLAKAIAIRERTDQQRPSVAQRVPEPAPRSRSTAVSTTVTTDAASKKSPALQRPLRCSFCEQGHWNDQCTKYFSIEERKARLIGKCLKCLRLAHTTQCVGEPRRCFHCDSWEHNRALCPKKFPEKKLPAQTQLATTTETVPTNKPAGLQATLMAKARVRGSAEEIDVRVVVDSGGLATVNTQAIAQALNIPVIPGARTSYFGLDEVPLTYGSELAEPIELVGVNGEIIPIYSSILHGTIPEGPVADIQKIKAENPQLTQFIPPTGEGRIIDILIGSDNIVDILLPQQITAISADVMLLPTKLGSIIVGRKRQPQHKVCQSMLFTINTHPLQRLADLDILGLTGINQSEVDEEEAAIRQFYETVRFVERRYSISWPWRVYPPYLDSNFGLALGRLRSLYKRLLHSPDILSEYHNIICSQLEAGIIEKVDGHSSSQAVLHYLPHHPIVQPEKSTSVRPVIDASSKSSPAAHSLNDNIRKGTKWINDLAITLLRIRKNKNVVIADIARAFHQIAINEEDRDAARFLWLKDISKPPTTDNLQTYRFTRVAFGIIASPFILTAVIRHHASQQQPNTHLSTLLKDMYADNLVAALDDTVDPYEFYLYAKQFFGSMSMNLTKWATNVPALAAKIPQDDQVTDLIHVILGIKWNPSTDMLSLKSPRYKAAENPTPRIVARETASWFDPLGYATPIMLQPKIFFRKIWNETKEWDTLLSPARIEEWHAITQNMQRIEEISLPRLMAQQTDPTSRELHTFVDASMEAYAVVTYLRTITQQRSETSLVMAKARLTPLKTTTIPRLELIALVLGCRMTDYVRSALQFTPEVNTFIWSDSRCAIAWMSHNKLLPAVIEKQVIEARKYRIQNINYVPSEMNYADVASRGASYQLLNDMKWWTGPAWLHDEKQWPPQSPMDVPEIQTQLLIQTTVAHRQRIITEEHAIGIAALDIKRFASLPCLLRRTAYILRAIHVVFQNRLGKQNCLGLQTKIDVQIALQMWIKWDQSRVYALTSEPAAGKPFPLRNIAVFRDADQLIRCQTRIINSCMQVDATNPILLVKKSTLTKLIILNIHEQLLHAGTNHTLAQLRQRYWLPQGRREVYYTILSHCFVCRRHLVHPYPVPPPAPLPEFRVTRTNTPFAVIGTDVCGPFFTRELPGTKQPKIKRWVILFTCAVVRAVHIEILQNMTADEFLLAFRRFFARRGVPQIIVSDNAPQYHVLDGHFSNLWKDLSENRNVSTYFAQHAIKWHFVPEISPWMGGMYERLVQSIKVAFEKTYGNKVLLDRQFETSIIEIESVLNSRPITYVDTEIESKIVTPNNFLQAKYTAIHLKEIPEINEDHLKKLWRQSQSYLNEFWHEWSDHYLQILRERNDQVKPEKKNAMKIPEKGDVVVMVDLSKKRSAWTTAIIERLIHSKDGHIRAAQIKFGETGRLIRPITSLAPLKMKVDLPNVSDAQLNPARDAIIVWPPEGAAPAPAAQQQLEESANKEPDR